MSAEREVQRIVGRAHRACVLAHGAEAFLVGAFGMLLALTAIAWQGSPMASLAAWGAALGAGVFAGAAWWLEVRPRRRSVARRMDRELGLDGALFTAWEQTSRSSASAASPDASNACSASGPPPVVRLLARELLRGLPRRRAQRCVVPNSMPLLALPFLGATLLALVRGVEPPAAVSPDWAPRVAALAGGMEEVESAAHGGLQSGEIDAASLRELVDLNARSRDLARHVRSGDWGPEQARGPVDELRRELERQARTLAPGSDLSQAVERAAARADSLLVPQAPDPSQLSGGPGAPGATGAPGESEPAPDPGATGRPQASAGEESGRAGDPQLTNAPGQGTMMDRSEPDGAAPEPPGGAEGSAAATSPPDAPGPAGIASGRWWSERDNPVVERWDRWRRGRQSQPRDED